MVDKKKPGLINPGSLDSSRGQDNVGNVLHLLESHFKMPHVIDAGDIANNPDAKAMATFLPFVVEALEGQTLFSGTPERSVFTRGSTAEPTHTGAPAAAAPSSSYRSDAQPSFVSPRSASPPPQAQPRFVGGGGGGSVAARTTPLRNFSASVTAKYPGVQFDAVNVDGKSAEGQLACQQCNGQLGSGRVFKFLQVSIPFPFFFFF
jgi:hypothetical protein